MFKSIISILDNRNFLWREDLSIRLVAQPKIDYQSIYLTLQLVAQHIYVENRDLLGLEMWRESSDQFRLKQCFYWASKNLFLQFCCY